MSEKRFVIQDSSVEEYVESLEVSFGFYLSSFAFYEAAIFQWLLFDYICSISVSLMYITKHNTTWKVLCTVFTHSLFCIRNLTRSLRSLVRFLIRHNSCVNTVRAHFPWSILCILLNAIFQYWFLRQFSISQFLI